ncbi:hypothetical protein HK099_007405 [Clydaea vesicula]|uniref:HpcH/HpaI aldolase/citrate lyase domain-containing protein n=1 Tax=Clydaea vesicula TaxID=447962 RepID=A0AAD5U023_9FUNG|nr:hypothetical protein HK099_007405 [Clydaea vesicula]
MFHHQKYVRKLQSSLKSKADCFVYDLEDGVAVNKKIEARKNVFNALETFDINLNQEKAVRINSIGSGLEEDDLKTILKSKNLEAIVIPKVNTSSDILYVSTMIDKIGLNKDIKILVSVESALGLINLKEIIKADKRVEALIFAAEDYVANLGMVRTKSRTELLFARQSIATTAVAFGIQSIDLVCVDYKNEDVLLEECLEGRRWGFTGKQVIHPKQVDIVQKSFLPSEEEVEKAKKILEGDKVHQAKGIGAFELDGAMIDAPMVLWAKKIISRITE